MGACASVIGVGSQERMERGWIAGLGQAGITVPPAGTFHLCSRDRDRKGEGADRRSDDCRTKWWSYFLSFLGLGEYILFIWCFIVYVMLFSDKLSVLVGASFMLPGILHF